ncbi:hypothetical protein [Salinigranum sp.]|uniref:hypothetical protein n=1 Tax=Salinigranum sp. TaxID=1966351 RepID=UPI00356AC797
MLTPSVPPFVGLLLRPVLLHGTVPSTPVPHWVVLLVAVPSLWLLVGGTVLVVDRLLESD